MKFGAWRLRTLSKLFQRLPIGVPGKVRLARYLFGDSLGSGDAGTIEVTGKWGCRYMVPSLRESIAFQLLINGIYEPLTVNVLLNFLRNGATFVDIGANIGTVAIPVAKFGAGETTVIAIEPSPVIFPYLKLNVELNGLSNVRLKRCAAYDHNSDSIPFYDAPSTHFGMGSLAAQFHKEPVAVVTQTLDSIVEEEHINRVDLIKVDVEGVEAAVFRGAEQSLTSQYPPLIVFEFCDWAEARVPGGQVGDAQRVLLDYGYHIWRLADFQRGKPPLPDVVTSGSETLVATKH